MGLQDVKHEILQRAEREADEILETAREEKEEKISAAEEQAQQIVEAAEQEAEKEAEALRKKELSSARMNARKMELNAQQAVLENVFDTFREHITDSLDEDVEAELIESALDRLHADVDIGTVTVNDAHEGIAKHYGDVETDDIRGVVIETDDGARRFDMRFEKVADRIIEDNRKDVAKVLFQ